MPVDNTFSVNSAMILFLWGFLVGGCLTRGRQRNEWRMEDGCFGHLTRVVAAVNENSRKISNFPSAL